MKKGKNQLSINMIASVVVFIVQFIINFWLSPYIVAKLGEEAQGFITLANNFIQYATLITVAINSMASRFISIEYNKGNTEKANRYYASVFWSNCILSFVFLISSFIVIFNLEKLINITSYLVMEVKCTFALSFINLMISCLSTCFVATTFVTNRMDYHAFVQIGSNIIKLVMIIGTFVIFAPHIYYVSLATLASTVFTLIIYIGLRRRLIPEFSLRLSNFSYDCVCDLIKAGAWILVSNISSILLGGMDLLLANLYISEIAMSRLSMAKHIPSAIGGLLGFLSNIFAASFTKHVAENNHAALVKEIHTTCRTLGFSLTVPFAGIIVYGRTFLKLWLPGSIYDNNAISEIYILMIMMLINVIINAYMYSIHSLFIATNKVKKYSLIILVCSIISITITIVVVKMTKLGTYAIAGISTIVLSFTNVFLIPRYAEQVLSLKPFTILKTISRSYITLLLVCVLFYMINRLFAISSWLRFIICVIVSACMGYTISALIMLNKYERTRIINSLRQSE